MDVEIEFWRSEYILANDHRVRNVGAHTGRQVILIPRLWYWPSYHTAFELMETLFLWHPATIPWTPLLSQALNKAVKSGRWVSTDSCLQDLERQKRCVGTSDKAGGDVEGSMRHGGAVASAWEVRAGSSKEVRLTLGFEACIGVCLIDIKECSLLVDQEQLGWLFFFFFFFGNKGYGWHYQLLTNLSLGSLQAFLFPQVPVCR